MKQETIEQIVAQVQNYASTFAQKSERLAKLKQEQQKFEKGRTIIPINYSDVRAIDFYQIRERYIDLLQDLSCEEAIQVLKEELKFQERTLTRN